MPPTTPLLPYVDPGRDPELDRVFEAVIALRGRLLNIHRLLANQPAALSAFMGMSEYVRDNSSLPADLRELAILTTSLALNVRYEWFHHAPLARQAGVSDEQLHALRSGADIDVFSRPQRSVIQYAREASRFHVLSDAAFVELREILTTGQIIDLALTVGWYHLCATILVPMRIGVEEQETGRDQK